MGHSQRNAQNGVSTQLRLGGRAVELEHLLVDGALLGDLHSCQCRSYDVVHVGHSLEHSLAAVALLVAVAQLEGLVFAC